MTREREYEEELIEIKAWEDTIVNILTDGHAKRVELEQKLRELKMGKDEEKRYGIQVGGCALIKNGRHAGSFGAACEYADMDYAKVQGFWHAFTEDPRAMGAMAECNLKLTAILVELGDKYGVSQGRMTAEERDEAKKISK